MDSPSTWIDLITKLGFPVVVCVWFMWRDYKFMSALQGHMARMEKLVDMLEQVSLKVIERAEGAK